MLRRSLTIFMTLIIISLMMVSIANANSALSLGGGISLTESEKGVSMGSRIDACRKISEKCKESGRFEFIYRPIASWFSSTGMMPFLVMSKAPNRPVYRAAADFNSVKNVEKVELTPDHGLTTWDATCVPLKGYQVEIPCLEPGGYGFEWKVTSRDKHNRLMIIFIPISWSSSRTNGVVQQTMVQSAPESCWNFTDEQWVSMLSPAFQPATALPDPGYLAKRAAQRQTLDQMTVQVQPVFQPQSAPQPVVQPQPEPEVQSEPRVERPRAKKSDGYVIAAPRPKVYNLSGDYTLVLTGLDNSSFSVISVDGEFTPSVTFTRDGYEVARACITTVKGRKIFARVESIGPSGLMPSVIAFDTCEGGDNR